MHLGQLELSLGAGALGKGVVADDVAERLSVVGGGISGLMGRSKKAVDVLF